MKVVWELAHRNIYRIYMYRIWGKKALNWQCLLQLPHKGLSSKNLWAYTAEEVECDYRSVGLWKLFQVVKSTLSNVTALTTGALFVCLFVLGMCDCCILCFSLFYFSIFLSFNLELICTSQFIRTSFKFIPTSLPWAMELCLWILPSLSSLVTLRNTKSLLQIQYLMVISITLYNFICFKESLNKAKDIYNFCHSKCLVSSESLFISVDLSYSLE